jgi:hypothetical protein
VEFFILCITFVLHFLIMLNVRLNKDLEKKLADYSERMQQTKSEVVKEALVAYLNKSTTEQTPYELGMDLFGQSGSGKVDGSSTYKSRLKDKLNEKHAH